MKQFLFEELIQSHCLQSYHEALNKMVHDWYNSNTILYWYSKSCLCLSVVRVVTVNLPCCIKYSSFGAELFLWSHNFQVHVNVARRLACMHCKSKLSNELSYSLRVGMVA